MATMTGRLYALAAGLGMVERNNKEDAFHQLVFGITGKEHVSELTNAETNAVQKELLERMKLKNQQEQIPGMITDAQKRYVMQLMKKLVQLDPSKTALKTRLVGVIRKELGVTASENEPFRFVNFKNGSKLIEQLKRYVRSAERRDEKGGSG